MNPDKQMEKLIEKARREWKENWTRGMMEYDPTYNQITVWVGREDVYKAFFDAETLRCVGTKC